MARRNIAPVNRERPFDIDELFFSTTDRKGIITSGNDVFLRVSGLERDELVGHAHNVVRHPDMPRAVFRLFWDYLQAGRPIASYVKNIASDGSYYWVMASAVPVGEGFVSIRLKPTSAFFDQAKEIYAAVRQVERDIEGNDPKMRKPAIEAGVARLQELLREAGYEDYDAFMHAALPAEITARDELLGTPAHVRLAAPPPGAAPALARILGATVSGHGRLDTLVRNLAAYAALSSQLASKSDFIVALADDIRLFSLNAMLAASRLGRDGASLGAVAEIMRACSDQAGPVIADLNGEIQYAVRALGDVSLLVAASKLQAEMVMVFVHEQLRGDGADGDVDRDLDVLSRALREGVAGMLAALDALGTRLTALMGHVDAMERNLNIMRALEVNGRIEAVRAAQGDSVEALFRTIAEQVALARQEMAEFASVGGLARQRDRAAERQLAADMAAVGQHVAGLAVAA
jgi:aerotaxis receptor